MADDPSIVNAKVDTSASAQEAAQEISDKYAHLTGYDRTFAHMWDLAFGPEIEKRKAAGTLPEPFHLWMGQVLIPIGGPNVVNLNDEVKGVGLMRAPRPIQAGDPITIADMGNIEKFDLPDEWLDHGHYTIIRSNDAWLMFFNFLSGRAKAADRLKVAGEFLAAAKESAANGHSAPSNENLFAAAELASKAELILHRSTAADAKTHGAVASAINQWGKLGNIDAAFVALFNKLGQQRPNARYGDAQSRPPAPTSEDFELVAAVIERGLRRVAKVTEQ